MFKIGDFSRFTRISVKMLRHYDEIGLLKPTIVDAWTGYRFYSAEQLPRLNRLIVLKDLGFSLDQIGALLDDNVPIEQLRTQLTQRRTAVLEQLRNHQLQLAQIEAQLQLLDTDARRQQHDIVLRLVSPQLVASIRQQVPALGTPVSALFDEVEAYVASHRARAISSPLTLFYDAEYREENLLIEVAIPLDKPIPGNERITVGELAGAEQMACLVYTGNYDKMPTVLNTLLCWLESHGFESNGPLREVYLRFGADDADRLRLPKAFLIDQPELFVTEVQLPVRQKPGINSGLTTTSRLSD